MARKHVIIISLQFVLILVFLGLAFIQKAEAERQREVAEANVVLAMKNAELARINALMLTQEKNRADSLQEELDKVLPSRRK
jgi:regulatory protein YycI of two-component signal transduction system YycFG